MLAFVILGLLSIASAVMVIAARKVVYSVFWLLLSFFSTAFILLLVNAEFLALVQILVNAGAVVISFLFVVILINLREEPYASKYHKQKSWAGFIAILAFIFMGLLLIPRGNFFQSSSNTMLIEAEKLGGNSQLIGKSLFTNYILPFEMIAIVLLVAIIGVVVLGKKYPQQNDKVEE